MPDSMQIIAVVSEPEEARKRYAARPRSPRQRRKQRNIRNTVCLMAVPDMEEHRARPWDPDSPLVFPVQLEIIKDHSESPHGSYFAMDVDAVGIYEALHMGYGGAEALEWLKDMSLSLYQKFTIWFTLHTTWSYEGDYDTESDFGVVWRGEPDVAALEDYMAKSSLLAVLEARERSLV